MESDWDQGYVLGSLDGKLSNLTIGPSCQKIVQPLLIGEGMVAYIKTSFYERRLSQLYPWGAVSHSKINKPQVKFGFINHYQQIGLLTPFN